MNVVWDLGEATVGQVRDQLAADKELAYTTVLSVLQKLEKAGWLKHKSDGRTYIYMPRRSRSDANRSALRQFTERMFAGDPLVLFEHLLDDERLTSAELAELKKMLERRRKELRDG
jgi:predicted transcriptional regulator